MGFLYKNFKELLSIDNKQLDNTVKVGFKLILREKIFTFYFLFFII